MPGTRSRAPLPAPGLIHLPLASEPSNHKSGGLGRGEQLAQITQMDLPNKYM